VAITDLKYQANQGTPEQLPSGAATTLNEANPQPSDQGQAAAPAEELQPAAPADYEPQFQPATDDEDFLTGPTTHPDEAVTAGTMSQNVVPGHVRGQLTRLQEAANAPGASTELKALVAYLLRTQ
jgi:hypothetical protein